MKKEYIGLTALLALSFVLFTFSTPFKRVMLKERAEIKDTVVSGVDTITEPPIEQRVMDTAAKNILFVGDSMLEGLGPRLAAYAQENGHTLVYVIWYSSTTEVWGRTDKLAGYIKEFNPDYIFISLGGNELFVRDIQTKRQKYVDNMLAQIGDIPYIWIGPPNWKEDTGINDMLEASCKKGTFYLSKNDTFQRAKDGAHPTRTSAAAWCDRVCAWVMEESTYPILLEKPEANLKGKAKVIVLAPAK